MGLEEGDTIDRPVGGGGAGEYEYEYEYDDDGGPTLTQIALWGEGDTRPQMIVLVQPERVDSSGIESTRSLLLSVVCGR